VLFFMFMIILLFVIIPSSNNESNNAVTENIEEKINDTNNNSTNEKDNEENINGGGTHPDVNKKGMENLSRQRFLGCTFSTSEKIMQKVGLYRTHLINHLYYSILFVIN